MPKRTQRKQLEPPENGESRHPVLTFSIEDFLNNKEFEENELLLIVEGKGANSTTYTNIEEAVRKAAQLEKEKEIQDQFSCYRLEQPDRWYIRGCTQELIDQLNNKTTRMRIRPDGQELVFKFHLKAEEVTKLKVTLGATQPAFRCSEKTGGV